MSRPNIEHLYSAGGVVYKIESSRVSWLLIKPTGRDEWRLAKGLIEKNETSVKAALREVFEESGAEANIREKIGTIKYFYNQDNKKVLKEVIFFLMESVGGNPENHDQEVEEVVFLPYKKAYNKLTYDTEKEMLAKGKVILDQILTA